MALSAARRPATERKFGNQLRSTARFTLAPSLHGDDVLFTSEAGTLSWLNAADGKQRLPNFQIDAPLRCTPTINAVGVMLSGCDSLLHVINAAGRHRDAHRKDRRSDRLYGRDRGERVYFGTEGGTFSRLMRARILRRAQQRSESRSRALPTDSHRRRRYRRYRCLWLARQSGLWPQSGKWRREVETADA